MKKILLTAICIFAAYIFSYAQEDIAEPDFIGEVAVVQNGKSTGILEKNTVKIKSTNLANIGFGTAKSHIIIEGCCAKTVLSEGGDWQFIVRAVDNNTDPLSIISVFRFKEKKKERRAEVASATIFGSSSNNLDYIEFTGKKYGTNSYLVTLKEKVAGQYGIIVTNPNARDEKNIIVASFAIR
jgi:hypothetical protein